MAVIFRYRRSIVTIFEIWRYLLLIDLCMAQLNRPPDFISDGDMSWLAIKEDVPVGSSVYTLMAVDPEGSRINYYIISSHFKVNESSGVVTLTKPLDREEQDSLEVLILATDEKQDGIPANTTELKRHVTIVDVNDNVPSFVNATYMFSVEENTSVGTTVNDDLRVIDLDFGNNAEISLQCLSSMSPLACEIFEVEAIQLSPGRYKGLVRVKSPLDYEDASLYILTVKAEDVSPKNRQTINMVVQITDQQDQPPVFVNSPYFWTITNNGSDNHALFVDVFDGDRGNPRSLDIKLIDPVGYFDISVTNNSEKQYTVRISASVNIFDTENGLSKKIGEFYEFYLKATEIENDQLTSVYSKTSVTVSVVEFIQNPPKWAKNKCNITTTKDRLLTDMYLSSCALTVIGDEKYKIALNSSDEPIDIFEVEPIEVKGTAQVSIRLKNITLMDIDEFVDSKYEFQISASNEQGLSSSAIVVVNIVDAVDNTLSFAQEQYSVNVSESLASGAFITQITVNHDENENISYSLEGFGSQWCSLNSTTGMIHLGNCGPSSCLDFEKTAQLSLIYLASDSHGRRAVTNLLIQITDVNDNPPVFAKTEVIYSFSPKIERFDPPLKLEAIDIDSSSDGNNVISYKIVETSPPTDAFTIDHLGEIRFNPQLSKANDSLHAKRFKIHVRAEDMGSPPLAADAYALVTIEKEVEGVLFFTHSLYNVTILETDLEGKEILQVSVVDPTQEAQNIIYRIKNGSNNNFIIDNKSGSLTIAPGAKLDLETSPKSYVLRLEAVDADGPNNQTASSIVEITVQDVNNKPPKFLQDYYVFYLSEDKKLGESVLVVEAEDPDQGSAINYHIGEVVFARDTNGLNLPPNELNDLKNSFSVNFLNGSITEQSTFMRHLYSSLCLSVGASDSNAVEGTNQTVAVEVFLIINRKSNFNPVFPHPWSPTSPQLYFSIPEEAAIGSQLFTLTAKCFDGESNITYKKLQDKDEYFTIDKTSGVVTVQKRLDYETLQVDRKQVSFVVKATNNELHSSTSTVIVYVVDINDNSPQFLNDSYWRLLPESAEYPDDVVSVSAFDHDQQYGFGDVRYSLTEDSDTDTFDINPVTGKITLAKGKKLDREKKSVYNLKATATDNPDGIENHRQSSVLIVVELQDVNDNSPVFTEPLYQAIFPETVAPDFVIRQIEASDADLEDNSRIRYSIDDNSHLKDFISINETNGILFVNKALSGKGRSEPYKLIVTATDHGDPSLSTNVHVLIFITDVSSNDGVLVLVKPLDGDVVYLQENSPPGTVITTLEVEKLDNSKTDSKALRYSFLGDGGPESDEKHFAVDSIRGVLSSRYSLDREMQANYTVVLIVKDFENPPNQVSLSLTINILDVDDHLPYFRRSKNSHPVLMDVDEEVPLLTIVGYVEAIDEDEGMNAYVDYIIIDPPYDNSLFTINRTADNRGAIYVTNRIDCETQNNYLLTVQAKRWNSDDTRKGKYININTNAGLLLDESEKDRPIRYDPAILSLIQIRIRVQDVDDWDPYFVHGNATTWIKTNAEAGDNVFTFIAKDDDVTQTPITYKMLNIKLSNHESFSDSARLFNLDERSGILRLKRSVAAYENSYFELRVAATSNNKTTSCKLIIYVLQNKELLKFVFNRPMTELKSDLTEFKRELQENLLAESSISADFLDSSFVPPEALGNISSVCFQVVNNDHEVALNEAETLIDLLSNPALDTFYNKFGVQKVEKCEPDGSLYRMNWVDISILVIAAVIVIVSTMFCVIICHMYKRYKRKLQQRKSQFNQYHSDNNSNYGYATVSNQRIHEWQNRSAPLNGLLH